MKLSTGVTEMLARLEQAGARIVECPATLEGREEEGSGARTFSAGVRHLWLMVRMAVRRMMG